MRLHIAFIGALLFVAAHCIAQSPESVLRDVRRSHIEGNVPDPKNFDPFMRRDVSAYFRDQLHMAFSTGEIQLLRNGPTQSGVAYPKYYAWVTVKAKSEVIAEGAIRLAAIDRVRFEVTDFLSKDNISSSTDSVSGIFPTPLVADILKRASQ